MRIGVAQFQSKKGDITFNIRKHLEFIVAAIELELEFVAFPELSLSGYEPTLAADLALQTDEASLSVFSDVSQRANITIGVGMPLLKEDKLYISQVFFRPDGERSVYTKQMLHKDELPFFASGDKQIFIPIHNDLIAPAICYESLQASHVKQAVAEGATIYVVSVAKDQNGMPSAFEHYASVAKQNSIMVMMVNAIGFNDNYVSCGQSSIWNSDATKLCSLSDNSEGLLAIDTNTRQVFELTYPFLL